MKETHICVVDRDGGVMLEIMATTLPEAEPPEAERDEFPSGAPPEGGRG